MEEVVTDSDSQIDQLEAIMLGNDPVDCPLTHRFIPGFYIREILMPANTWVTSMKHLTCHPFFVLQGKVSVFSDNDGSQFIESPYSGVTYPNTRRVLYIHENCVWTTIHRTDIQPEDDSPEAIAKAVSLIEDQILDKRENQLIGGIVKNNIVTKNIEICPSSR